MGHAHWITTTWPLVGHLGVSFTFVAELLGPMLLFAPDKGCRFLGLAMSTFLQLGIGLTGNYGAFNFLTMALGLSALYEAPNQGEDAQTVSTKRFWWLPSTTVALFAGTWMFWSASAFSAHPPPCSALVNAVFAKTFSLLSMVAGIGGLLSLTSGIERLAGFGILSLSYAPLATLLGHMGNRGLVRELSSLGAAHSCKQIVLYKLFKFLDSGTRFLATPAQTIYNALPYGTFGGPGGVFGSMSGIGGRPIVALEGAHSASGPWLSLPFRYQTNPEPGTTPSFAFPHFPRLDWTMWFIPLGSEGNSKWLVRLLKGIVSGQKSVLNLLDRQSLEHAFPDQPPSYVRLVPKTLTFTSSWHDRAWWNVKPADVFVERAWDSFSDDLLLQPTGHAFNIDELSRLVPDAASHGSWPSNKLRLAADTLEPALFVRSALMASVGFGVTTRLGVDFLWGGQLTKPELGHVVNPKRRPTALDRVGSFISASCFGRGPGGRER